ncbi:mkg-p, partial [Drosophila busckii]
VPCAVCGAAFENLQECLAHELLMHMGKAPKKERVCFNAISRHFASENMHNQRRELNKVLQKAKEGQELYEILKYYSMDCNKLADVYYEVRDMLERRLAGRVKVYPFGSLVTGLALKNSDIDLYLELMPDDLSPPLGNRGFYNAILAYVRRTPSHFTNVFAIRNARVPIIRFRHVASWITIDINVCSPNSTYNSRFVAALMNFDVRIRQLCLFLKIWTKKLRIVGSGSMTSYCLIVLIIYALQKQGYLPAIKKLQVNCAAHQVDGVNFVYDLKRIPGLPKKLTAYDLIAAFFAFYSDMDFTDKLLSPYIAQELKLPEAIETVGGFPEYEAQMQQIKVATGVTPDPIKYKRDICVQDPFELQYNVAQSIAPTNLTYFKYCVDLATSACKNECGELGENVDLYEYLLFGLPEQILQDKRQDQAKRKKMSNTPNVNVDANANATAECPPTTDASASASESTSSEVGSGHLDLQAMSKLAHTLRPSNKEVSILNEEFLTHFPDARKLPLTYFWTECYFSAIKDIVGDIYGIKMKRVDKEQPLKHDCKSRHYTWLITASVNTWSERKFKRNPQLKFFTQQLQETKEYLTTRADKPTYMCDLKGHFSFIVDRADYKEVRLEIQPLPDDPVGLQRLSQLTKFFKSLKNMLSLFDFREKVVSWQYERL